MMKNPVGDNVTAADPWSLLEQELDRWQRIDAIATFWWRDDDATVAGPKLERLLKLTEETGILLAVIPAKLDLSLASLIIDYKNAYIAQHGYAHINHAPRGVGAGAWELGLHRPLEEVMQELKSGKDILDRAIQQRFLPIVVPPWNHIDQRLIDPILQAGFWGVSAFGARELTDLPGSVLYANAHCDPIRWKTGAKFRGEMKTLVQLIDHLHARRIGKAQRDEATGYLTHHIDLDAEAWRFSEKLLAVIVKHPAAAWLSPHDVIKGPQ